MLTITDAKLVFVCQILRCNQGRYLKTVQEMRKFNDKVDEANAFLKENCGSNGIKFWRHRGMVNPNLEETGAILCPDGVHLSYRGQYKYYKSLRGTVLFGMKELN